MGNTLESKAETAHRSYMGAGGSNEVPSLHKISVPMSRHKFPWTHDGHASKRL